MNVRAFAERLRNPRFVQGRGKIVDYAANWAKDPRGVARDSEEEADLLAIIRAIGDGNFVPERCYRHGIDRDQDLLLNDYGIKHFHLGGADSDTVLFLVEYEEFVLFLDIGSHVAFASKPPGSVLRSLHDAALRRADALAARQRQDREERNREAAHSGLLSRRKRD